MTVEVVVENGGAEVSPVAKIVTLDVKRQGSAEINVTPNPSMEDEGDRIDLVRDSEGRWVVRWWKARISRPFMLIVRRGTEPRQLAFSAALGVTLGVFPIYGVTLFLCAIAVCVLRSRCHAPTLMLTNFVATPLELALLIPFLRLGEWLTNGGHIMLSSNALWKAVTGKATKSILLSLLHALVGWAVAAPAIMALLYFCFLPIFSCLIRRYGAKTDPGLQIGLLEEEEQ
ncbi:uncharacterized protein LOC9659113 isoform X2 [Selaginella moellendorffii]|uniref:uncharacterized protein LOC9659113 isoform X2 n=1 Tax=Selaginella moellendorffii TaxID=88036 RepID=UPI000D1CE898|nr:uncharacterized protein LOC9659113 isoform X2 [Selaginella moellendorffii]XP_024520399.1 uncharacterized protein LOC9659113 isoform X2 [Selaginella moellendorffii]|eukprot:XP_002990811.2 uncharacterized protein LOC9659113 isoform X2 [Selaginella moellendorffii]